VSNHSKSTRAIKKDLSRFFLGLIIFIAVLICSNSLIDAQIISVNTGSVITSFDPSLLYGNNSCYRSNTTSDVKANYQFITDTARANNLQHSGCKLLRWPGGSLSDYYHWNGTGNYDSQNYWVPSATSFTPGFVCRPLYKGTTNSSVWDGTSGQPYYSNITDGNTATKWRSLSTLTTAQWVYVDLGTSESVTNIQIVWDTSYATNYLIQYYTGTITWDPYEDSGGWSTISIVTNGTGGTDNRSFTAHSAEFWRIYMTSSSGQGFAISELYVKNGTTNLTNNTNSSSQTHAWASSMDPASLNPSGYSGDFDFDSFMTWCNTVQAEPILTVNFGTGTPHEAANWVRYARNKGYNIKYWEIGNEQDGDWEVGGPVNANDYTTRYIQFADSMKAADNSISIGGPVSGAVDGSSYVDANYYEVTFLNQLKAAGKTTDCNFLVMHSYPFWNNNNDSILFSYVSKWNSWGTTLRNAINTNYGTSTSIPIFLDEYNSGMENVTSCKLVNGLWITDYLMSYAKNTGNAACIWDIYDQLSRASDNTWGDYGCYEGGNIAGGLASYKFQPRSSYWGLYELSNYFSIPGSGNNNLVSAVVSSALKLDVYANKRSDNRTSLLVINRDSLHPVIATVNLSGFVPISNADVYTFSSANYVWHANEANSYAHPDTMPTHSTISAGTTFTASFPPYSINVVVLSQKAINSIEEISENGFSIYPNPANEYITLTNPGSDILKIQVFDLSGMILIDIITSNPVLNVQCLPTGMYILKVNNQFIKFIKL